MSTVDRRASGALPVDRSERSSEDRARESSDWKRLHVRADVLSPLVAWCNESRDGHVREKLAQLDAALGDGSADGAYVLRTLDELEVWDADARLIADWAPRRALANVLAGLLRAWTSGHQSQADRILGTLRDTALSTHHKIFTSIVLTKSGLVDHSNAHAESLRTWLWQEGSSHPQIRWTMAANLTSAAVARRLLDGFDSLDSDWAKRRLIVSVLEIPTWPSGLRQVITGSPTQYLSLESSRRFLGMLLTWSQMRRTVDPFSLFDLNPRRIRRDAAPEYVGLLPQSSIRRPDGLQLPSLPDGDLDTAATARLAARLVSRDGGPEDLRVLFDVIALELDASVAVQGRPPTALPQARYSRFKELLRPAIDAAIESGHVQVLYAAIGACLDEAPRFALAQHVPRLLERGRVDEFWRCACLLMDDENDWVVRETLENVDRVWETLREKRATGGAEALGRAAGLWYRRNVRFGDAFVADVRRRAYQLGVRSDAFAREFQSVHPLSELQGGTGWGPAALRWQELTGEAVSPDTLRMRFRTAHVEVPRAQRSPTWTDTHLKELANRSGVRVKG